MAEVSQIGSWTSYLRVFPAAHSGIEPEPLQDTAGSMPRSGRFNLMRQRGQLSQSKTGEKFYRLEATLATKHKFQNS